MPKTSRINLATVGIESWYLVVKGGPRTTKWLPFCEAISSIRISLGLSNDVAPEIFGSWQLFADVHGVGNGVETVVILLFTTGVVWFAIRLNCGIDGATKEVVCFVGGVTIVLLATTDGCTEAVMIGRNVGCCIVAVARVGLGLTFGTNWGAGVFDRIEIKVGAVVPTTDCAVVVNGLIVGMLADDNGIVVTFNLFGKLNDIWTGEASACCWTTVDDSEVFIEEALDVVIEPFTDGFMATPVGPEIFFICSELPLSTWGAKLIAAVIFGRVIGDATAVLTEVFTVDMLCTLFIADVTTVVIVVVVRDFVVWLDKE